MPNIILYQFAISPFCDKIRRILNYKQQDYQCQDISLLQTQLGKTKRLGTAAKLPVLEIDNNLYHDSTNIAYQLETIFPQNSLLPKDKKQLALLHFFEDWADESLYFYEVYLRFVKQSNKQVWGENTSAKDHPLFALIAKKIAPKVMTKIAKAQGIGRKPWSQIEQDLHRHFDSLNNWLEDQDYLVGEQLTLADIAVLTQVLCIIGTPEGLEIAQQYKNVMRWQLAIKQATD